MPGDYWLSPLRLPNWVEHEPEKNAGIVPPKGDVWTIHIKQQIQLTVLNFMHWNLDTNDMHLRMQLHHANEERKFSRLRFEASLQKVTVRN